MIGSGPIVIGQAAEFDYAGTQACRALREEGIETVLVNSNPATIMTDPGVADVDLHRAADRRDGRATSSRASGRTASWPTLGGQTGLNLAVALRRGRRLRALRRPADRHAASRSIQTAEDRELFKQMLLEIGEPVPASVDRPHASTRRMAFADADRLPA